jgi:hypothetical protein
MLASIFQAAFELAEDFRCLYNMLRHVVAMHFLMATGLLPIMAGQPPKPMSYTNSTNFWPLVLPHTCDIEILQAVLVD